MNPETDWTQSYNRNHFNGRQEGNTATSYDGNVSSYLTSFQDLQPLTSNADSSSTLLPSCSTLLSSVVPSQKETKYRDDSLFNGACKENPSNYLQCLDTRNDFKSSDPSTSYAGQAVPSISYNSSNLEQPQESPFGLLPHLAVKGPSSNRSNDNFIPPISKTHAAYNNGAYAERDGFVPNPLSVSSSFSADTATPSPSALNSISSSFSSPSNEYSFSPQTIGAYNKPVHSPMPPSPSMAHPSYPSSPYTNIDSVGHMPPCSPMNGGTYVNNLNAVPVRNGLPKQSMSNNLCYTPQSHMGPMQGLSKTSPDVPHEYVYAPDRISPSSYSSGYASMPSSRISNDSRLSLSPRGNHHHEAQMRFGHQSAPTSDAYFPSNMNTEGMYPTNGSVNMQPPSATYRPPPQPPNHRNYQLPSPALANNAPDDPYVFTSSEIVDDKGALEMFNCQVNQGARAQNSYASFGSDYQMAHSAPSSRYSRSPRGSNRPHHYANNSLVTPTLGVQSIKTEHPSTMPEYYESNSHRSRLESHMSDAPRRRGGRRGRRRGGTSGSRSRGRGRGQSWRTEIDKSVYFYHGSNNSSRSRELDFYSRLQSDGEEEYRNTPASSINGLRTSAISDRRNIRCSSDISRDHKSTASYGVNEIKNELDSRFLTLYFDRRNTRRCSRRQSQFEVQLRDFLRSREIPKPGDVWPSNSTSNDEVTKRRKRKAECKGKIRLKFLKKEVVTTQWYVKCPSDSSCTECSDESEATDDERTSPVSEFISTSSQETSQEVVTERIISVVKREIESPIHMDENHMAVVKSRLDTSPRRISSNCAKDKESKVTALPTSFAEQDKLIVCQKSRKNRSEQIKNETLEDSICFKKPIVQERKVRNLRSNSDPLKDPQPGPSTQPDLGDSVSDQDVYDDSDTDPAWTPATKSSKATDPSKVFAGPSRKRTAKPGRKSSTPAKRRKVSQDAAPKKPRQSKPKPSTAAKKNTSQTSSKRRNDTVIDRFLIAKADINLPTPFIWRVDEKSSTLQRFEISEQNGVLLYHGSFTYAAGNEICVSNYVTADVKVLSPNTVQYLGPNLSDTAETVLSTMKPKANPPPEEKFDHLKEDFTVYIQSLLSQDVDSTFLEEIKKFNDEYFLVPIEKLETISAVKKRKLVKEFWSEELKKCIDTFPQINILDSAINSIKCQVCQKTEGIKLLQFHGQAYDPDTLKHTSSPVSSTKTQYSVCDNCSISVSLYNRLHHHKYNLFVECHAKANQVKSNDGSVQSHEDVLKMCLEDNAWIEKIFKDQVQLWSECKTNS